jgi:hypothetical protein
VGGRDLAKHKRDSLIFLGASLLVVVAAMIFYINTAPVLSATPSDGCMACHLDSEVLESMYCPSEDAGGGGG